MELRDIAAKQKMTPEERMSAPYEARNNNVHAAKIYGIPLDATAVEQNSCCRVLDRLKRKAYSRALFRNSRWFNLEKCLTNLGKGHHETEVYRPFGQWEACAYDRKRAIH